MEVIKFIAFTLLGFAGMEIVSYLVHQFIFHGLFAHKRFLPCKSNSKIMRLIRRAHQNHHQSADKAGQEPYGLFLFPYDKYPERNSF